MSESKIMGYARVSSTGQNLDRQIQALVQYVAKENIVTDKVSGKDLDRAGYQALKGPLGLRPGDTLIITSLDRLSRSKSDIKTELLWFRECGIRLMVLDLPTTMMDLPDGQNWIQEMINNILIEVLSSIAEQERLTIRKRQREGIEAAKKRGKHLGRPKMDVPDNWEAVYNRWKEGKITAKQAMAQCGLKKGKFYELVRKYGERE